MFQRFPLFTKIFTLGLLMAVLFIALSMVLGVVSERSSYRDEAARDVAQASASAQEIAGPVIVLPYFETWRERDDKGNTTLYTQKRAWVQFAARQDTQARLQTETRQRGIFPVTVYNSTQDVSGGFVMGNWKELRPEHAGGQIQWGKPLLLLGVSDLRGMASAPRVQWGAGVQAHELTLQRQATPYMESAMGAELELDALKPGTALDFKLALELSGTSRIGWVPLADENKVTLQSPWPHPSFGGQFLPRSRSVGDKGFAASWSVTSLASKAQTQYLSSVKAVTNGKGEAVAADHLESFEVALVNPVDVYHQTERAAKYGFMFIVLTFGAFFVFEVLKRWRIHPMQYLMVGMALVVFFLLLLSLSERIGFAAAYAAASAACIGLLTYYLNAVLGGWRRGAAMGGLLTGLYGLLYGILASEDSALLMGSLLLFAALGLVMTATRKLDWYKLAAGSGEAAAPTPQPAQAAQTA